MPRTEAEFAAAAVQEATDLHVVLQAWFNAEGDASLDALLARFDAGFTMVTTGGAVLSHAQVAANFAKVRGSRPGLRMDIHDATARYAGPGSALVTYKEVQTQDGTSTQRVCTALLLDVPGRATPVWRHLQETWIT